MVGWSGKISLVPVVSGNIFLLKKIIEKVNFHSFTFLCLCQYFTEIVDGYGYSQIDISS